VATAKPELGRTSNGAARLACTCSCSAFVPAACASIAVLSRQPSTKAKRPARPASRSATNPVLPSSLRVAATNCFRLAATAFAAAGPASKYVTA